MEHFEWPPGQGACSDPNLPRNHVDRCALRRQQPRYRSVFECLSVSSQVCPSSPPPGLIYGGDNYSDAGGIASLVFDGFQPGTEPQTTAIRNFSELWHRLAAHQFTEAVADEYNALKHGFRTIPGGFRLQMGPPATSSEPPPDSEMRLLGESKHGAMFYKVVRLDGMGGRHLSSQRIAVNWSITGDALLLHLVALSIHNIVTRLKTANGFARDQCIYKVLEGDDGYVLPWKHSPGVTRFTFPENLPQGLPDVSKVALLQKLREALDGNG